MAITVKLTDGGANTLTFDVDSYFGPTYIDFDSYNRTTDATLKHYTVASKRRWELGIKNISNADKSTLLTIYNLRSALEFHEDSAAAKTANVFWMGEFNFVPTGQHRFFWNVLWEGSIILEET